MSTRSTLHFSYGTQTHAIVYRHSDGYPEGAGADIKRFLIAVSELSDTRLNDPTYLAARYVVWLSAKFAGTSAIDFLSVGVMMEDPCDIQFRYVFDCNTQTLKCYKVRNLYPTDEWTSEEVDISTIEPS